MKIKVKQIEDGNFIVRCNEVGETNHVFSFNRLDEVAMWVGKMMMSKYYVDDIQDHQMLEIIADVKAVTSDTILEN